MTDNLEAMLNDAGFETVRLDRKSVRDGSIWSCKIGVPKGTQVTLPGGSDLPMRNAVEEAFKQVTGLEAEFCFSGWGAELTEGEQEVLNEEEAQK